MWVSMPSKSGHRTAHSAGRRAMTSSGHGKGYPHHRANREEKTAVDAASTFHHSECAAASAHPDSSWRVASTIRQKRSPLTAAISPAAAPLPAARTICLPRPSGPDCVRADTPAPSAAIPFRAAPYPAPPFASVKLADPAATPTAEKNDDEAAQRSHAASRGAAANPATSPFRPTNWDRLVTGNPLPTRSARQAV